MLTQIPNGLDEIIAAYGSLDDPQFENKHIVSFDLPFTCATKVSRLSIVDVTKLQSTTLCKH